MDQMFWTCEMCGHKNRLGETFCSQCGHKATNFEISEALKHAGVKEESESDFTRIMKRADLPLEDKHEQVPYRRRAQEAEISDSVRKLSEELNRKRHYPIVDKATKILQIISVICLLFSVVMYIVNGYYNGIGKIAHNIYSSIWHLFVNTYNYFFNIQFNNNMVVRFFALIFKNLSKMIEIIIKNITNLTKSL